MEPIRQPIHGLQTISTRLCRAPPRGRFDRTRGSVCGRGIRAASHFKVQVPGQDRRKLPASPDQMRCHVLWEPEALAIAQVVRLSLCHQLEMARLEHKPAVAEI